MDFTYLKKYILTEKIIKETGVKKVMKLDHNLYSLDSSDIQTVLDTFNPFPIELKQFYETIGCGLFHCRKGKVNRLLDPVSLVVINECRDNFKNDIEVLESKKDGQLIFFEGFACGYFSISCEDNKGKNAIYYKGEKIDNSLSDFLYYVHNNKDYLYNSLK